MAGFIILVLLTLSSSIDEDPNHVYLEAFSPSSQFLSSRSDSDSRRELRPWPDLL